ncbi:zinc-dependent alcohol dehydrogenase [Krasilnikovia cinnamomea]|uniref:zinc-dependent alcohol dehydrogenase n=1 Tax=Krasilnikovia cinnamomea TaxID=349313 RepID=UPI00102AB502|nr:zinc-binding alcohol dehydrogenase [Krasilnikovia cinnamomea]
MLTAPGQVGLTTEPLPPLNPGEVCLRTVLSGISAGTELAWLTGRAAALHAHWDAQTRMFTAGPGRAYPVAPGYESVAEVAAVGTEVTALACRDLVTVDAPHADLHVVAAERVTALPTGVGPEAAVFFTLARVALGGVHDAAPLLGESLVVTGLGTVGLLAAQQARLTGARVVGVDRQPLRVQACQALGIPAVLADATVDVAAAVRAFIGDAGADAAIECSGASAVLHQAIRCLRVGGRVATVASYHGDPGGLRLGEEYHRNRITLLSSMTINGCPARTPTWTLDRLNATAREQITAGAVRVDQLITHRIPFAQAPAAYALLRDTPEKTIKVVLTYDR